MEFYFKIHETENETILAISDAEIIGKKFEENNLVIEAKEDFYSGEKTNEGNIRKMLGNFSIINAIGNKSVEILVNENLINSENIISIEGVKHAQVTRL